MVIMNIDAAFIAALTGLIGAISGYLSLKHNLRREKHQVYVEFGEAHLINVPGVESDKLQFTVKVANLSSVPFTVASVAYRVGRHSGVLAIPQPIGSHQIPVKLGRDDTCNFWISHKDVLKSIKKLTDRSDILIRARITDYAGNEFSSKWKRIHLRETRRSRAKARLKDLHNKFLKLLFP